MSFEDNQVMITVDAPTQEMAHLIASSIHTHLVKSQFTSVTQVNMEDKTFQEDEDYVRTLYDEVRATHPSLFDTTTILIDEIYGIQGDVASEEEEPEAAVIDD